VNPEETQSSRARFVEHTGIEFISLERRYGTPRRLFTIWFGGSLSILCVSVGTLGILSGLPLAWTILALALGNAIGTVFMAAHSAQGPQLGIPQMIQSRAQFGVIGAGLPLLAVIAATTLYSSADGILTYGLVQMILPVGDNLAIILFGALTLFVAFVGYELIHRIAMALSVVSGVMLLASAAILLSSRAVPIAPAAVLHPHFIVGTFILVVTQATAWSLSSAPYVADYSRYLPPDVSPWKTFWYTGAGNFLGSVLPQALGAYLASTRPAMIADIGASIAGLFGRGQYIVALLIIINLMQVNVMNLYSAYMSSTTTVTGLRGMSSVSLKFKFVVMSILMSVATILAIATKSNFSALFSDFLVMLVYVLIPWSAINLADYYLVCKGQYSIEHMFLKDGAYGMYRWKTLGVYLLSILIEAPFMRLSFFVGPVAHRIGADIAWLPGLLVPGLLYLAVESRRI
jgi:NCS1 family nucleobase:cation symporter-1